MNTSAAESKKEIRPTAAETVVRLEREKLEHNGLGLLLLLLAALITLAGQMLDSRMVTMDPLAPVCLVYSVETSYVGGGKEKGLGKKCQGVGVFQLDIHQRPGVRTVKGLTSSMSHWA